MSYPYTKNFTPENKSNLIKFLRDQTTAEWGGTRLYDGTNSHLQQNPYELVDCIDEIIKHEYSTKQNIENFLEIGFHAGYTITILNKIFNFKNIVAVDTFQEFVDGNSLRANHRFKNLILVCGNSTTDRTIEIVKTFSEYDLILIDADHSYEIVKQDFENYKNLLSKNGIILLHDVKSNSFSGVTKLWNEIENSNDYKTKTIFYDDYPIKAGIGMIYNK